MQNYARFERERKEKPEPDMSKAVPLSDLEIVACSKVEEQFAPMIVPPIFRYKGDTEGIVFPERIRGDKVLLDGMWEPAEDLELGYIPNHGYDIELKVFQSPIETKENHTLWTRNGAEYLYQPSEIVREELVKISSDSVELAVRSLAEGVYDKADKLAQKAINADAQNLVAWAAMFHARIHTGEKGVTDGSVLRKLLLNEKSQEEIRFFDEIVEGVGKEFLRIRNEELGM
jgi:hypothetical protein